MQIHHLNVRHEENSPIYNEWLDIKAPYTGPTMEAKDVTTHVLKLIWASLYDLECYEVLKAIVTSPMSPKNVA